jgi:uncharacterized phage protein gp47/JayE
VNPYKSHDQLFNEILTSYRNAAPSGNSTELYVRAAGLASVLWGLYRLIAWTLAQMFPSTAAPETLERYAQELGLDKRDGESWESLLTRVLDIYRNISGGGNRSDVERWALEVKISTEDGDEFVDSAKCHPAKFGPGTSVIVVSKAVGTPSQALRDAIRDSIIERGPVAPAEVYVLAPSTRPVAITITMVGGSISTASALIAAYVASLQPGQTLFPVILRGLCMQAGATVEPVVLPSAPTIPGPFERIVLDGAITWL